MKITVHCLVKNEDIWVWFALQSVLPFVDKILVYDTGSDDKTASLVQSINSKKIIFKEKGEVDRKGLVALRQEMIDKTDTEWFLILDGDEIWPQVQFKRLLKRAEEAPKNLIGLITNTRNCLGDVYHYLPESAGHYQIGGHKGNLTIRLIRKTKDMHMGGIYPYETWSTKEGVIQDQSERLLFSDTWYLHTTYLQRSSIVKTKTSGSLGKSKFWEKGHTMRKEELPEVLFKSSNIVISNPLKTRGVRYEIAAGLTSPILRLKRKLRANSYV